MMEGPWCRFRREARAREDIDTVLVDRLKALDPNRPIREADIGSPLSDNRFTGPKTWLEMREKKEFSSSVGARISSLQKGQISVARLSEYRLV